MGRMPLGRFSGQNPKNLARFSAIACVAGLAAITGSAMAQAGQQATVAEQGARLHAGPSEKLYTIRVLEPGMRLNVLGDPVAAMLPVAYPSDLPVYVPAAAVEAIDSTRLRVTRATRLIAPHASQGVEGSWRSALQRPIPPGGELTIISIVRSDSGDTTNNIIGYMVQAPAGAIAYISQAAVQTTAQTTGEQSTPDTTAQATNQTNLLDTMVPPTDTTTPAELAATPNQPTTPDDAGALATNQQPVVIDQATNQDSDQTPNADGSLRPAQLETLYQSARAGEDFTQELDALLTEHRRTLNALADDPFNQRIRQQLDQRIAYIEMRIAFRDGPAAIAAKRVGEPSVSERMAKRLEEFTAGRGYAMVGKLVPSRIYDGINLPKLYRLRSPDALGRTLGYVRPGETDLTPYLNKVVGISGKIEAGPAGTKILTPIRVEVIDDN